MRSTTPDSKMQRPLRLNMSLESEPEEAEDDSADDKEVLPASKKRGRPKKAEADIDEEDMEAPKNLIPAPKDGAVFERTPPPGRRLTIKRLWYDSVPGEDEEFVPGDDSEFMEVPKKQGRHKNAAAGSKAYKLIQYYKTLCWC